MRCLEIAPDIVAGSAGEIADQVDSKLALPRKAIFRVGAEEPPELVVGRKATADLVHDGGDRVIAAEPLIEYLFLWRARGRPLLCEAGGQAEHKGDKRRSDDLENAPHGEFSPDDLV